jgi:acyl carrier protein
LSKDDVFQKLKEILAAEFELDPGAISLEKQLYTDLDLDSIDAVDLVVYMKEFIPGKIDPTLFKEARTVQDLVDILYPRWGEGSGK